MSSNEEIRIIEEFTPYHKSFKWADTDNYYKTRGKSAWYDGEVPYYATSNSIAARQNANLIYKSIQLMHDSKKIEAKEPIYILEMASGLGLFAVNFLIEFRKIDNRTRNNFYKRLKFLFTDYSVKNLTDARDNKKIQEFIRDGVLVLAELNALEPRRIRYLDKKSFEDTPNILVAIANYMHVVMPAKIFWKKGNKLFEKYFNLKIKLNDTNRHIKTVQDAIAWSDMTWKNAERDTCWFEVGKDFYLSDMHKKILEEEMKTFDDAKGIYPYGSFTNVEKTIKLLRKGGIYIISDASFDSVSQMVKIGEIGRDQRGKDPYTFTVNLPFIKRLVIKMKNQAISTHGEYNELQTLLIQKGGDNALFEKFKRIFIDKNLNRDAVDLYWAGNNMSSGLDAKRSVRLFERILKLKANDSRVYFGIGRALSAIGEYEKAIIMFKKGKKVDYFDFSDCSFEIGYTYHTLMKFKQARHYYKESLKSYMKDYKYYNLGLCYKEMGEYKLAKRFFEKSLIINPNYELGKKALIDIIPYIPQ